MTETSRSAAIALVRGLGPIAATAIVIGDVIGTGVFLKARVMTCNVGTPPMVLAVWVAAGLLSLAGALTYAELAALMPRSGGEYVFLREAYGRLVGFLYGWMRFFVGSTGALAALATGFAIFLNVLAAGRLSIPTIAIAAIAVVTLVNCAAVTVSGRVATALTALKIVLVVGVGVAAAFVADGNWAHFALAGAGGACEGVEPGARGGAAGFGAAMMGAMWAYNGWNEVTYVAGEVRNPQRNLPLALIGGVLMVAAIYVFVNAAYFHVLTPAEVASVPASSAVATEAIARFLGPRATSVMAAALAMSVFSALLIVALVCARVPYAMARDGLFFRGLERVSPRTRVPVRALIAQAVWASVLVVSGSFDTLTDYAMFAVLMFLGLGAVSVFVFRRRLPTPRPDRTAASSSLAVAEGEGGPTAERPYRVWGYPVVPMIFALVTAWLIVNTLLTMPRQALAGLGLIALGVPVFWYWSRRSRPTEGHG